LSFGASGRVNDFYSSASSARGAASGRAVREFVLDGTCRVQVSILADSSVGSHWCQAMKPDAFLQVRFKLTSEGGRRSDVGEPPEMGEFYACPLFIDGEGFDCRLLLHGRTIVLGQSYEIPVKFLSPDLVLPKLALGKTVALWEGKEIATGTVIGLGPLVQV